ncbi:MAG: hypothetical protein V2A79_06435 [Planctomycetota bacterium]
MIRYRCDQCGCLMTANDPRRFILKMEIYAAAAPIEFNRNDLVQDHTEEIDRLVEQLSGADPDEIENQTYRSLRFDLCRECQREFLKRPLREA